MLGTGCAFSKAPSAKVDTMMRPAPVSDSTVGYCAAHTWRQQLFGRACNRRLTAQALVGELLMTHAAMRRGKRARLLEDEAAVDDGEHDGDVGHGQRGRSARIAQRVGHAELAAVAGQPCAHAWQASQSATSATRHARYFLGWRIVTCRLDGL